VRNIKWGFEYIFILSFKNHSVFSVSLALELLWCTIYSTTGHRNWCC